MFYLARPSILDDTHSVGTKRFKFVSCLKLTQFNFVIFAFLLQTEK